MLGLRKLETGVGCGVCNNREGKDHDSGKNAAASFSWSKAYPSCRRSRKEIIVVAGCSPVAHDHGFLASLEHHRNPVFIPNSPILRNFAQEIG